MKKNKGGRPIEYTEEVCNKIIKQVRDYTDTTECPKIAEFCYLNDIRKQVLYSHPEFSDSIKRLIEKKEAYLEQFGLDKNNSMAIFSLKQLGWKDTQSIEYTFNPEEAKKKIKEIFFK